MNLKLEYLDKSNIEESKYIDFLKKIHGDNAMHRYENRGKWYSMTNDYHILLAILDDKVVGQASYYTIDAVAGNENIKVSWGADTFVLDEARGKGIGKKLQKKLHEDAVNFSSAWYSPINGIIKRKCGAREFSKNFFPYYPISRYLGVFTELAIKKLFNKEVKIRLRLPNFYYLVNKKKLSQFTIKEIPNFDNHIEFIQEVLSNKYDFYVKRNKEYLEWKYFNNPDLKEFHILEISKDGNTEAILSFSEAKERTYLFSKFYGPTILDVFIKNGSEFVEKHVIPVIVEYYKKRKISLDGIITIFNLPYFPKLIYPSSGSPLLSTYIGEIKNPYISLTDQDMEQL